MSSLTRLEYWAGGLPSYDQLMTEIAAECDRVCGIYVRISDDDDLDETGAKRGLGLKRQETDDRAKAARLGWKVGRVYADNDRSASTGKPRPGYRQMLADLQDGLINAVIVWDLDRLTRLPRELEEFMDLADAKRIALASVGGDVDLATPQGRLTARIKGAVGKHESEQIGRRVARKHYENAKQGKAHGGRRPYGYDPGGMTVRPAEARVVRMLAERVLAGDSLRQLAMGLNDAGVPTVTGRPWRPETIKALLCGPHIAGLRLYRGKVAGDGAWPAIIDRGKWETIRARLLDPSRRAPGYTNTRRHLLTGIARCGKCGANLQVRLPDRRGDSYACKRPGCQKLRIARKPFEKAVVSMIFGYFQRERIGPPPAHDDPEQAELDAEIAAYEQRRRDIPTIVATNLALTPEQVAEQVNAMVAAIDDKLTPLYARRRARQDARLTNDVLAGLDPTRLAEEWDGLSLARQRSIIGMATDGVIVVSPARHRGCVFDASRISVPSWEETASAASVTMSPERLSA